MNTLRSMTAFARASHHFEHGAFILEVQSVNRRFLETTFHMPSTFYPFEASLRTLISSTVARGHLTFRFTFTRSSARALAIKPNLALVKGLQKAWEEIKTTLGSEESITLSLLAREKELFHQEEEEQEEALYHKALQTVCEEALIELSRMKEAEGMLLTQDLLHRVALLEEYTSKIEEESSALSEKIYLRLKEKIQQLLAKPVDDDERLYKEVALLADKSDVTEEIVRLKSHIVHLKELLLAPLASRTESKGKRIEFFVQEIGREYNTIGSKTTNAKVTYLVIESKSELEKIKEQSQNIE